MHALTNVIAASFWLFTSLAWTQTVSPLAPSEAQAQRAPIPLQVSIPTPPSAFRADMQWHLCYEIYLTNLSSSSWMVQHIDVKNESGAPLLTRRGKELETVLSLLGSSGNCGEPHLHFQLMDRNSPLNSEGLPYYFPGFKLAARISGDSEGQLTEARANLKVNRLPAPEAHHGDIPLENEVVDFEP